MLRRSVPRRFLEALLFAYLLATFTRTFVLQGIAIPSGSMEPTLLRGDHVVVNKLIFGLPGAGLLPGRAIRRGDVVLVRPSEGAGQLLIKRCLGLPGETIEIHDNRVLIDGVEIDESGFLPPFSGLYAGLSPTTIAADSYFLLGDSRGVSIDSRQLGAVRSTTILGRVQIIYWSYDNAVGHERKLPRALGFMRQFAAQTRWRRTFQLVR